MNWFDYLLIGWWVLGMLIVVASVGKPKKPTEPLTATFYVAITLLLIVGLLFARGAL